MELLVPDSIGFTTIKSISFGVFQMMNIALNPEQEQLIQSKLKSGKYATATDVIVEALRLLEERDRHYEKWLAETREKVTVGLAELDRGEGIDGEVVIANLREKFKKARESQG
jgi:antitoxin ParD1/3/4